MELVDYRRRVARWLAEHVPHDTGPVDDLEVARAFQAALHDAGYAGITWPSDCGGQGLGQAEQQAFAEEAAGFELPVRPFQVGVGMCGPTLVDLGTPEQKARYLRPLLRGEEIWCQLFSEPGAGSDVAGLTTRAVRDGPEDGADWVVSGQKVWTSGAQWADLGALLARTDPTASRHAGLTMFVLDMHAPGVTVRPLTDMTGGTTFTEVFLDDVRIPGDAGIDAGVGPVIGEVNGGWRAAVTMLGHERVTIGGLRQRRNAGITSAALTATAHRHGTAADPAVRDQLVALWVQEQAIATFNALLRQELAAGREPGSRGSIAKLATALALRHAVEVAGAVAPDAVLGWDDDDRAGADLALGVLAAPASGIAGGTNEIQRSIIGERLLGLPKEPSAPEERRGPAAGR